MSDRARPRPSSPRIAPLEESEFDEEAAAATPTGAANIFRTLARHPKLLKRWLVFGNHVLFKSTLPARERELIILRTGWRCSSEYEFGQHRIIGLDAGLTDAEIEALCGDPDAYAWSDDDQALIAAVDELHEDQCISDATWAALARRWTPEQILDIIFAVGQYTLVSMALNSCGVPLDDGLEGFRS